MSDADTPSRLISAAERLFIEGGEAATSLRAVARLAHANAAAVHYHFGGRDELLRAVFRRQLRPVAERRMRLLAEAGRDDPPSVSSVAQALIRPDLELLGKLRKHKVEIARFLGRSLLDGGIEEDAEAGTRAVALLARAVPAVDPGELAVRVSLLRLQVAALFAAAQPAGQPGPLGTADVEDQVRALVATAVAALTAPASARPRKRRKHAAGRAGRAVESRAAR
jgi:AcrR family transcriptional regulator